MCSLLDKFCSLLPHKDSHGRQIFLLNIGAWNPKEMSLETALIGVLIMAQYASYDFIENQQLGFVTIWDFSGFTMQHAWAVKHKELLKLTSWLQNGILGRIKAYHMILHPRVVPVFYMALKPFLKEKLKKRVYFHGDDMSSLHIHIGPDLLPTYCGGNITGKIFYDKTFVDLLLQQDPFFNYWATLGFPVK